MNTKSLLKLFGFQLVLKLLTISCVAQGETVMKVLSPCPNKPNCVSSQAKSADQFVAPYKLLLPPAEAWLEFQKILKSRERTKITEITDRYLRAESTSFFFRFVDDIEAMLDSDSRQIHIRSASRLGYRDFGVNRKRIEELRQVLHAAGVVEGGFSAESN
jgi:uncharacterized protein (DUF1499 family)